MTPTAYTADVADAFLAVWRLPGDDHAEQWAWRFRDCRGRCLRGDQGRRGSPGGAKSAAAAQYKARVRDAQERVSWTPCTPEEARAHGDDAADQAKARAACSTLASCVRAQPPATAPVNTLAAEALAALEGIDAGEIERGEPRTHPGGDFHRAVELRGMTRPSGSPGVRTVADVERPTVAFAHYLELLCGDVPAEDKAYLAWLHELLSVVSGGPCEIAHHEPPRSHGRVDYYAVPLTRRESEIRHGTVHPKEGEPTAEDIERVCLAARLPLVLAYFTAERGPGRRR